MTHKRIKPRCWVLRADGVGGRAWYIGERRSGWFHTTERASEAREFKTLAAARLAHCEVIWPEWRIWRRGKR